MQETWTIKFPQLLTIPGFQPPFYLNRKKGRGGGVGFYVRNGLSAKILPDLTSNIDKVFESISDEISYTLNNLAKQYIVSNIYRSPTAIPGLTPNEQLDRFHDKCDNLLNTLSNLKTDAYVFLDSNISNLNIDTKHQANTYVQIVHCT